MILRAKDLPGKKEKKGKLNIISRRIKIVLGDFVYFFSIKIVIEDYRQ